MSELSATVPEPPGEAGEGAAGTKYGRFQVVRLLGYGGMGAVFAAKDPELDREVAIKVLHSEVSPSGEALRHEAQAMARLTHPNTVSVYEVGQAHGQTFIVMELIAGVTLRAWLDERPRPWPQVVSMFVRAGRGLEAAHRAGLVHRDFKPENVLVDGDGWPRVADFGLASVSFAKSGGTPAFMAPEQWLEGEDVGARADQFAFAVAVWRALVGGPPFPGESRSEVREAVLAGAVAEPPEGCPMPRAVEAALRRALARQPEARWPSLTELLAELERASAAPARRPRWLVPVVAASAVATGLSIALVARPDRDGSLVPLAQLAPPPAPDAPPPRMFLAPHERPGRAAYKLTDSIEDLEELANRYQREALLENLEQTLERLIMMTTDPREKSGQLNRLANAQAMDGECDRAKRTLARYLAGYHEKPYVESLEQSIRQCEANKPPPRVRVPGKNGTGVAIDEIKLLSGNTDVEQVRTAFERIAQRFRSCAESARRGGLVVDHVGLDMDVKADGVFAPHMYEDTDDAQLVKCLRTTIEGIRLYGAKPGRVKFTMWFDD